MKLTALRWWIFAVLSRMAYHACPDRKALDFVMRHGTEVTKACRGIAHE